MNLNDDQSALRDSADRFIRARIAPEIARMERERSFDWALMEELAGFGFIGATLPPADGGLGLGYRDFSILMETVGYHWLSLRALLNVANMVAHLLHSHGNAEQREKYLTPLLGGKKRAFIAITEPDHGSNVHGITARAIDCGDHFKVSGRKLWITNGTGDFGLLLCRVADGPNGKGGLTTLILDPEITDYDVTRIHTMILHATETTEIAFADAVVPKECLLGEVGGGLHNVLTTLSHGRLSVASGAVGAAQCALDLAVEYARTRTQFGRPIGSQQLIQDMIADMTALTRSARWLCYDAAMRLDNGETARLETSLAKRQATEWAHEVASMALQIHGGIGYSEDLPIERIFRDTRGGTIPEGTTQIQTLIIGREILGLDAFNPA
jgi:alkylation response protein AidB-like acyl-CoA dehydrogenase